MISGKKRFGVLGRVVVDIPLTGTGYLHKLLPAWIRTWSALVLLGENCIAHPGLEPMASCITSLNSTNCVINSLIMTLIEGG